MGGGPVAKIETLPGTIYDYPAYYDLAFRSGTADEADFLLAAVERYGPRRRRTRRLLEPACGSGRLVLELAARGHDVAGFDLEPKMVSYAKDKIRRRKLSADVFVGDMTDFRVPGRFDAAFNLINTFRHLTDPADAEAHLRCVARCLRKGGVYVLGIILVGEQAEEFEVHERWRAASGDTKLTLTLTVPEYDHDARLETLRFSMVVTKAAGKFRIRSESPMRLYTPSDVEALLARVPELQLAAVHDFQYEIDRAVPLADEATDRVLILRRIA